MAHYYYYYHCDSSSSSSSSSSFSRDEWRSFRSTSSSKSNNSNFSERVIIPCFSHHHYHCVATLKTQNHHHITCLATRNSLLYAASGNDITVFDLTTLKPIKGAFNGPDSSSGGFIKSVTFYDEKILTAHQDSRIRVWKRHRLVNTLPTLKDKLRRFLSPKSYVQVRRHKRKLWIQHNDAVSGLAVNNGFIYSVSWDKTLKIWRGSDFKCIESVTAHDDAVNAVTVSATGRVYTGSADGSIRVWERNDQVGRHSMVDILGKHSSTVNALALSKDGDVLLSGGCDGIIVAWEREMGSDRMVVSGVVGGHDGPVLCLISLDGHGLFVSGSADRTVRVWGRGHSDGWGSFCCLAVMEGHHRPVRTLAVVASESDPNGVVSVCSGSLDGEIKIWRVMVSDLVKAHHSVHWKEDVLDD